MAKKKKPIIQTVRRPQSERKTCPMIHTPEVLYDRRKAKDDARKEVEDASEI